MSRRPKQTFLQRRHTDGRKAHEKMLNVTNYKLNANKKYNDGIIRTGQNGHHFKNLQITNAGEDVEKREPSYTVGGNVNW